MSTGVEFYSEDAFGPDMELADSDKWSMYVLKSFEQQEEKAEEVAAEEAVDLSRAEVKDAIMAFFKETQEEGYGTRSTLVTKLEELQDQSTQDVKALAKHVSELPSTIIEEGVFEEVVDLWVDDKLESIVDAIEDVGDALEDVGAGLFT